MKPFLVSADNEWLYEPGDGPNGSQKMLLVHQSPFQKRMLKKYGNLSVGMDATYKTNLWGFPLINIVVVDNHGHGFPVATALIQSEEGSLIAGVLRQ